MTKPFRRPLMSSFIWRTLDGPNQRVRGRRKGCGDGTSFRRRKLSSIALPVRETCGYGVEDHHPWALGAPLATPRREFDDEFREDSDKILRNIIFAAAMKHPKRFEDLIAVQEVHR